MNPIYTHEEVTANFQAMIDSRDFNAELRQLGVSPLHIMRRKHIRLEFKALFAGLWRLCLMRSFPDDGRQIFDAWLASLLERPKNIRETRQFVERAQQYADMLNLRGDADFSEISRHMISFLSLPEASRKSAVLKLALEIRKMYNFIFERVI